MPELLFVLNTCQCAKSLCTCARREHLLGGKWNNAKWNNTFEENIIIYKELLTSILPTAERFKWRTNKKWNEETQRRIWTRRIYEANTTENTALPYPTHVKENVLCCSIQIVPTWKQKLRNMKDIENEKNYGKPQPHRFHPQLRYNIIQLIVACRFWR